MYLSDQLEIWNLTPNSPAWGHAQTLFNVAGRLKSPDTVENLLYSLNDYPEKPVYFNRRTERNGRLHHHGDFNIDTILTQELTRHNRLKLRVLDRNSGWSEHEIAFHLLHGSLTEPNFKLDLDGITHPQQVGQIVDGKWRVSRDEADIPCLEIKAEDAGLDRIILFGQHTWGSSYEITARLSVTTWTGIPHNIGLVFKWNPHRRGDGASLPTEWSTGLGYYYSQCPGLRIRFGVNVCRDASGNKIGDYILKEAPLSFWRSYTSRIINRFLPLKNPLSQISPGAFYRFRMRVDPAEYALTVWVDGQPEPAPQLSVPNPVERLPQGSVGIIAHRCGVRIYEYKVSPL